MKKYKFRLQVIERHRIILEQKARVQLSKSLKVLHDVQAKIRNIDEEEFKAKIAYAKLGEKFGSDALSASQFWVTDQFIRGQKIRRAEAQKELIKKEEVVKENYSDYLKSKKSLQIIEKLRQKDFAEYKDELNKHERKELDDIYTMRDRLSNRNKNFSDKESDNE